MLSKEYAILKSGTDIRGIATDDVEGEKINLTDDKITSIAFGFLTFLSEKLNKNANELKIGIGRDSRISGPKIRDLLVKEFSKYGITLYDFSYASTPAMFMSTLFLDLDGAVEITASHHPFNRNGLKFFTKEGGFDGVDIIKILEYAQDNKKPLECDDFTLIEKDIMETYSDHLKDLIKKEVNADNYDYPLESFHIVVDAGNGVGGFYAERVLKPLGADISGSCFLDPDGMFPNHIPNPENEEAMKSISSAVLNNNADLGVIFDTDVDRGGAVDKNGKEINRNRLIALASFIALKDNKGGTVVTDSITSTGVKDFIENHLGGVHYRYVRGYKNLINKVREMNDKGINAPLAAETSGHVAMRENYFLDDGAYLCTKIIILMAKLKKEGKTIDELLTDLKEPAESKEIRIDILDEDFKACGNMIIDKLTEYAESREDFIVADDNREGIRVSFDKDNGDGWFLLRLSVHDPVLPLNIESDSVGGVEIIEKKVMGFLSQFIGHIHI